MAQAAYVVGSAAGTTKTEASAVSAPPAVYETTGAVGKSENKPV